MNEGFWFWVQSAATPRSTPAGEGGLFLTLGLFLVIFWHPRRWFSWGSARQLRSSLLAESAALNFHGDEEGGNSNCGKNTLACVLTKLLPQPSLISLGVFEAVGLWHDERPCWPREPDNPSAPQSANRTCAFPVLFPHWVKNLASQAPRGTLAWS